MSRTRPNPRRAAALAALTALLLAGCGTPAVVTPAKDPLPGLTHDVQSAKNVAKQLQSAYNADGGTGQP
jgi:hypothetical protein